jgi:hypothetical protein
LLLSPAHGRLIVEPGFRYALDNGAWSAFQSGSSFDEPAFSAALAAVGRDADWTVVPDIVEGGLASLALSLAWLPRVLDACPRALIAVQDSMSAADVAPLLSERVGIFVGGSTSWKINTMALWGALGRSVGCWVHVGRVNTARRMQMCAMAGVDSVDGTSASRYSVTVRLLDEAVRQQAMVFGR